jgi:uncharacterized membrane protein HdeD (DUF308 family)
MPRIFLSYRREDSQDVTGRIYDHLVYRYSEEFVFKDVDSIPLGSDFRRTVVGAVQSADVVLAIIGPRWLTTTDALGQRRLDNPDDFVRVELETALRTGKPVIPITVSNARMVTAADLPESIRRLAFHNGLPVRPDPDFRRDMGRLFAAVDQLAPGPARPAGSGRQGSTGASRPSRGGERTANPASPGMHSASVAASGYGAAWSLAVGIAVVLLGLALALGGLVLSLASVTVVGWLLLIAGGLSVAHALLRRRWNGFFRELFAGVLYIVFGLTVLGSSFLDPDGPTRVIAAFLVVGGILRIGTALATRFHGWIWMLVNGVVSLLLGLMTWGQWPVSALWVCVLVIGVDLIFYGWSLVVLGIPPRN